MNIPHGLSLACVRVGARSRRLALMLLAFCSHLALPGFAQLKREDFPPDQIVPFRTIGDVTLSVHVFKPAGWTPADQRPAVVFFFGGGWTHGSPAQFYPHARHLASRGLVVFSAEYRVKDTHGTDPFACVADAKAAIRWVRTHAKEWGIAPDRIGAGGGSAGGHLAAAAAFVRGFDEDGPVNPLDGIPNALVLYNAVIDNGPGSYGHDRIRERYPQFSPMHNIGPGAPPPTVIFLGTQDKLIPVKTGQAFADRIRAAGGRCDLHLYEAAGHGFFNYRTWPSLRYYETLRATERFLTSIGWLEGEPTLPIPDNVVLIEPKP